MAGARAQVDACVGSKWGTNRESTWERLVCDVMVKNVECGGGMGQAGDAGARAQVDAC